MAAERGPQNGGASHLQAGTDILVLTWLDRADRNVLAVYPRDDPRNP